MGPLRSLNGLYTLEQLAHAEQFAAARSTDHRVTPRVSDLQHARTNATNALCSCAYADGPLDEPPETDAKRRADMELLAQLRAAKRVLESLV